MYNYPQAADNILIGMHDYLSGFTVHHSDKMYNFYKELVFTMSYEEILKRLSYIYKIPQAYWDPVKLSKALTVLHKKFKEYENFYMQQRDVEADMSKVTLMDLDNIALTLERFTATFIRHLTDLKNGFNLFLVIEHQQKFFKAHNFYDMSGIENAKDVQQNQTQTQEVREELRMNITNMGHDNIPPPKMDPQEFITHLQALQKLANEYFDTHLKPGTKYNLEMKLVFPQT